MTERVLRATAASFVISPDRARRRRSPTRPARPTGSPRAGCSPSRPGWSGDRAAHHRRGPGRQAGRHVRARRHRAVRLGRRPGRVRPGAHRGRRRAGQPLPRRGRARGPRAPGHRRHPPEHHVRPTPSTDRPRSPDMSEPRVRADPRHRPGRHPGAGLGGHRHRARHRLLVHGPQRGRAPASAARPACRCPGFDAGGDRHGVRAAAGTSPTAARAAEDGAFMAFEYLIEGRDGGATALRLVHSGILGGDWEARVRRAAQGQPALPAHPGAVPASTSPAAPRCRSPRSGPQQADQDAVWAGIIDALGLTGTSSEGDKVRFTVGGAGASAASSTPCWSPASSACAPTTRCCGSSAAAA